MIQHGSNVLAPEWEAAAVRHLCQDKTQCLWKNSVLQMGQPGVECHGLEVVHPFRGPTGEEV